MSMSVASRLTALSYDQLLGLVVSGCEESAALKNRADALVAEAKPLPTWCVTEILLSPDLLPVLMSTLRLQERGITAVCSTWASAYATHIGKFRFVLPTVQRSIEELPGPQGMCMLPNGVLAVACSEEGIQFVAAHEDTDPHELAECHSSRLASKTFGWPMGIALTDDSLLVCDRPNHHKPSAYGLTKFGAKPSRANFLAEVGTFRHVTDFRGVTVHQAIQRAYALTVSSIFIVDLATMTLISTILSEDLVEDESELRCVAVCGDSVIVSHDNVLSILDLDGKFVRSIGGPFIRPNALAAAHGRIYLTELHTEEEPFDQRDDDYEPPNVDEFYGRRLFVIDVESGQIVQTVTIQPDIRGVMGILVHDQHIYLSGFYARTVSVLRFAGDVP